MDRYEYDDEGPSRARSDDTWTSHEAGRRMTKELRRRQYHIILDAIRVHGPGTIHYIAANCSLRLDQVHKRLPEMGRKPHYMVWRPGDVADGPSGRPCKIWHEDKRPRKPDGSLVDEPESPRSPNSGQQSQSPMYATADDDDGFGPAFVCTESDK